jgi:hypothetical protein
MIRPGDYTDRGMFMERGVLYRPTVGGNDGEIEPVPAPWFDRWLLRWLPKLALSRAQARAALRQLEQQMASPPGTVHLKNWNSQEQRWEPAGSLPPSPFRTRENLRAVTDAARRQRR